jgi:hypothetical protein
MKYAPELLPRTAYQLHFHTSIYTVNARNAVYEHVGIKCLIANDHWRLGSREAFVSDTKSTDHEKFNNVIMCISDTQRFIYWRLIVICCVQNSWIPTLQSLVNLSVVTEPENYIRVCTDLALSRQLSLCTCVSPLFLNVDVYEVYEIYNAMRLSLSSHQ